METLGQDFSLGKGMLFLKKPYQPQTLARVNEGVPGFRGLNKNAAPLSIICR